MATNGKADMDCILPQSETYIRAWHTLSMVRAERTICFDQLEPGASFTLPGGMTVQTKLNFYQARAANGQILIYEAWEAVAPV
jgi:hypothetical protein